MRILVLAPHADDEVYGCGGMIRRSVAEGHTVDAVVLTMGTVSVPGGGVKCTETERHAELSLACVRMGVSKVDVLFSGFENCLLQVGMRAIVTRLDGILERHPYDQIYFPTPSHHQDHRILHDAMYSALRVRPGRPVELLAAMYEYPYVDWGPTSMPGTGKFYLDISPYIDDKLDALRAYKSQVQPDGYPLSLEGTRRLAALRGTEVGVQYAELFYVVRMVQ